MTVQQFEQEFEQFAGVHRDTVAGFVTAALRLLRKTDFSTAQIDDMTRELEHAEGEVDARRLELRNVLLRLEMLSQLEAQTIPGADLGVSRQALEQRRKRGQLVAVRGRHEAAFRYPLWQFDDDLQPLPEIKRLTAAAHDSNLSGLELHRLMLSESAGGGTTPVALLDAGEIDRVVSIIRAAGDQAA